MEKLAELIPTSIVSLIGLAVVMGVLIMLGTVVQEWGKSLYRKSVMGGREKRSSLNNGSFYEGIERRTSAKHLDNALSELIDSLTANNKEFQAFVSAWRESHYEMKEDIELIKRHQDKNWKRLFDEELPNFRDRLCPIKDDAS